MNLDPEALHPVQAGWLHQCRSYSRQPDVAELSLTGASSTVALWHQQNPLRPMGSQQTSYGMSFAAQEIGCSSHLLAEKLKGTMMSEEHSRPSSLLLSFDLSLLVSNI